MAATNASKLKAAAKTVVEKNLQAGKKVQVGGVGESRRHGGHGPAIGELKSKDCHVNGEPLPEEFWGSFPYSLTDEGKAEAALLRRDLPVSYAPDRTDYSQIFDDDKKADRFREALADDTDGLVIIKDPMAPLVEKHTPIGHHGMFMSKTVIARQGLVRGVLEYSIVYIDDGNGGKKEVNCGSMVLASVPQHLYEKAQRHYAGINKERQVAAIEQVQEQAQDVLDSGRGDRSSRRRFARDIQDVMKEDDGSADQALLNDEIDRRPDREAGAFHE